MSAPRTSYPVAARPVSKVTISTKEIEKVKPIGDVHSHCKSAHKKQLWKIMLVVFIILLIVFIFVGPGCVLGCSGQQGFLGDNLGGQCNNAFGWSILWALVISLAVAGLFGVFRC